MEVNLSLRLQIKLRTRVWLLTCSLRAEVVESISHAPNVPTVLGDGEVALSKGLKLSIEVEGTRLLVPKKLGAVDRGAI